MFRRTRTFCVALTQLLAAFAILPARATDESLPFAGAPFDAAPFGLRTVQEGGRAHEIRWGEPRKIRKVVLEFPAQAAIPSNTRLQYWRGSWNGKPDPVLAEEGAGGQGWAEMDDWTNGKWIDADSAPVSDARRLQFTFAPTGRTEFKDLGQPGVTYRKTLKIRVVADESLPAGLRIRTLTDAVYRPLQVRVLWASPAAPSLRGDAEDSGRPEIFNGHMLRLAPAEGTRTRVDGLQWTAPAGGTNGLEAELLMAVDPVDPRYDRTIVTVRSKLRPFSFEAADIARGNRILVDDLGALVVRDDDPITVEEARAMRNEFAGRTIYERVGAEGEQTLRRAVADMPLRRPMEFVHGLPGNRNLMQQEPNGDVVITSSRQWFSRPASEKDTARKHWAGDMLRVRFGLPDDDLRGGRALRDGYLPLLRTWWQDGPLFYEQCTVMDRLAEPFEETGLDDPTVLLVRIRVVNTSAAESAAARLRLSTAPRGRSDERVKLVKDRVMAEVEGKSWFRFLVRAGAGGELKPADRAITWSLTLEPGKSHDLFFAIPSITLETDAEIEPLARRSLDADADRICAAWAGLTAQGTQIDTPEPWINDFYRAHFRHMLINCYQEPGSDRLRPHVGSFYYGVYSNESMMMVSDLDRRGYHDLARRCLDTWLAYQGTVGLPGNFKSQEGIFYGANRHESGGYNKHHGYVMWGMADHWRCTRDRAWMERAVPALIRACDWITRERRGTMVENPDGTRPIEYGFLPAGGLEDVQDYWYWLATNAAMVWGFDAVADAVAEYGHAEADRLTRDAKAYHDDVVNGLAEARVRTPVVRLRDGTWVPKFPSHLHARGRAHGWIRETLEGAIFLPVMNLVDPRLLETTWILKDYEDNLYISDQYGYAIPAFDNFWFSRGGISMQANLLDGPLPYLDRDEVKHFLRAYFNGFASAFDPQVRMCNEHSLPELGWPRGDHFKTSDEAQSTYWLRLMFVNDRDRMNLVLGQAIPRDWMRNGRSAGIERSSTYFGPVSFRVSSHVAEGEMRAVATLPEPNRAAKVFVRLRHPKGEPIRSVTLNGQPHADFDPQKEWVILPGSATGRQEIVARY